MWELLFNFLRISSSFGADDLKWYRMIEDVYHETKDLSFWTNQKLWGRLWKELDKHISGEMRSLIEEHLRRRMNKTRSSRGNNYNLQDFFTSWMKLDNRLTVKSILLTSLRKFLAYDLKLSGSLVKRGVLAFMSSALNNSQINTWFYKRYSRARNSKWYYLTNTHHSDFAIYKMRVVGGYYKDSDLGLTNMQIQFMKHGSGHIKDFRIPWKITNRIIHRPNGKHIVNRAHTKIYEYEKVPVVICCIMINAPLTYLTKNGYLAGAWNFFWYSCVTNGRVSTDAYGQHASSNGTIGKDGRWHPEPAQMVIGSKKGRAKMRMDLIGRLISEPIHKLKNKMIKPQRRKGGRRRGYGNK